MSHEVCVLRHPLIHLRRFVPEGHPAVFDITKRKIHNVLQGVSPEGVEMSDDDRKSFETWTEQNCITIFSWSGGAADLHHR
jgi:hypothetical protein